MRPVIGGATLALCLFGGAAQAANVLDPDGVYVVKAGDTLSQIAQAYLTSVAAADPLQKANSVRPRALPIGAKLRVPGSLLRTEPIQAEVAAFSGQVNIDAGAGPVAAKVGMSLGQGALIATGANAFVTLVLPDESRITLPSVSRVRLTRLRKIVMTDAIDRVFTVEAGRIESTVTPMTNKDSRYVVDSPVASSAVRGTVFRMAFDPASGHATAEVVKGVVGVQGGGSDEVKVEESFGAAVDASGVSQPIKLLAPPTFEKAGRVQDEPKVTFAAAPLAGASAYRIQIANDAGFVNIFDEATSDSGAFTLEGIKDGSYFLRATAIDGRGLEGLPRVYGFTRELNALEGGAPAASGAGKTRRYLFRWNATGDGTKTFRFQIFAGDDAKQPQVDQPGLTQKTITLTNLPAGHYTWRVIVSTFKGGRVLTKEGPLQDIEIGQ